MTPVAVDIWALCDECDRWFYCPVGSDDGSAPICPVCGTAATAIVNRANPSAEHSSRVTR